MVVITEKELKKRAEHNYGRLHNLEEVRTRCCCCCCGLGGGCGNLVDHIDVVVAIVGKNTLYGIDNTEISETVLK